MNESLFFKKQNAAVSVSCFQFIIHCTFTWMKLGQRQGFIDSLLNLSYHTLGLPFIVVCFFMTLFIKIHFKTEKECQ